MLFRARPSRPWSPFSVLIFCLWGLPPSLPSTASAQVDCGRGEQGRPVPQTRSEMAPGEFLWPRNAAGEFTFRPAADQNGVPYPIPPTRDSAEYRALGSQIASAEFGLELFTDVARLDDDEDWLFVSYNVGFQVWDLRQDPANPVRVAYRDGWAGEFEEMPDAGEVDVFVESLDVVESDGRIFVGLAGRSGHGFSLWEFTPPGSLVQYCQVSEVVARQLEMVEHGGRPYAFVGTSEGLQVYDVESSTLAGGCAFEGFVGDMTDGSYVSVLERDGRLFAAAADGSALPADPLGVEIWEVDPELPAAARKAFSGFSTSSRGVALFSIGARSFLGLVNASTSLEFYDVTTCLSSPGPGPCGGLGAPLAVQAVRDIGKLYEFLDISTSSDGRTWAYYGFVTSPGLFGRNFEYLLDLTPLAGLSPEDGPVQLAEVTDGGDSYSNPLPCLDGTPVDYWGDYYTHSRYGLNFLIPRHGLFIGDTFYRAAFTLLDVHELVGPSPGSVFSDDFESGTLDAWSI